jgi:hypothetical protein
MSEITFEFDWLDPAGARGEELRATWARLSIFVGNEPVTRLLDERSRTVRDSVYVPLYPLAEWFATHWWALRNEVDTPERTSDPSYETRHLLREAREGYALPSLRIQSVGNAIRCAWGAEKLPRHKIQFVSTGVDYVDVVSFEHTVSEFVAAVVTRLSESSVRGTLLEEEWSAINRADEEERAFCNVVGALGLDPYDLAEPQAQEIVEAASRIPNEVHEEFFVVADPRTLAEESKRLSEAIQVCKENTVDLTFAKQLRSQTPSLISDGVGPPWRQGYEAAKALRKLLSLDGRPIPTDGELADALHLGAGQFEEAIYRLPSRPHANAVVDAVVGLNSNGSPGFAIAEARSESIRFHFCRGLFEYLSSRGEGVIAITRAASNRQKRNRAFAAEFLAPSSTLHQQVAGAFLTTDDIEELASEFGVSSYVISHQIQNHRIAALPST